jgi:CheY-like chemotaxis protein
VQILVVDDSVTTATYLSTLLRSQGHTVRMTHSGTAAIAAVAADAPDAILLDINMPDMDGFTCCQELKRAGYGGLLIAVSGYGSEEDQRRSAAAGFAHHLVKPIDLTELRSLLGSNHEL